jgi:hypothetical protein
MPPDEVVRLNSSPGDRLRQLDAVLDDLEDLNLRDLANLPVRVGSALMDLGIDDPYIHSITELIDRVFELQEPVLAAVRSQAAFRRFFKSA